MRFVFYETEAGLTVTDGNNFTCANVIERDTTPIIMSGISTKMHKYYFPQNSQKALENLKLNTSLIKDQRIIAIFEKGFVKTIDSKGIINYYQCL